jgi:hypothetical protein
MDEQHVGTVEKMRNRKERLRYVINAYEMKIQPSDAEEPPYATRRLNTARFKSWRSMRHACRSHYRTSADEPHYVSTAKKYQTRPMMLLSPCDNTGQEEIPRLKRGYGI